jgi:hypothetical protein
MEFKFLTFPSSVPNKKSSEAHFKTTGQIIINGGVAETYHQSPAGHSASPTVWHTTNDEVAESSISFGVHVSLSPVTGRGRLVGTGCLN